LDGCPSDPDEGRGILGTLLEAIEDVLEAQQAPKPTLQPVLDCLAAKAGQWSPGTDLAISVQDLASGETASTAGSIPHVSASSAKAIWLAAALDAGIPASELEADARAIATISSNDA